MNFLFSAHKKPQKVTEHSWETEKPGIKGIITAAGYTAHLPGFLASWTTLPVTDVPVPISELRGIDALLSISQMPAGAPVACVGVGQSGANNGALLAAQTLAIGDKKVKEAYRVNKEQPAKG